MLQEEKGVSIILVALMLVVMIGFLALVVDIGLARETRARLQTTADAAALAGAHKFWEALQGGSSALEAKDQAEAVAREYLDKNGFDPVGIIELEATESGPPYRVTVILEKDTDYAFIQVLNVSLPNPRARAVTMTGPAGAYGGIVPVFLPEGEYDEGEAVPLKYGAGDHLEPGEYGQLNLPGQGLPYKDYLKLGYPGQIKIGDVIPSLSGDKVAPNREALKTDVDARLKRSDFNTWEEWDAAGRPPDDSRLVVVPLCDIANLGPPNKTVEVVGFTVFFIEDFAPPEGGPGGEGHSQIIGRFVNILLESDVGGVADGDEIPSLEGVYAVNLVR